jgi:hypothetical protein
MINTFAPTSIAGPALCGFEGHRLGATPVFQLGHGVTGSWRGVAVTATQTPAITTTQTPAVSLHPVTDPAALQFVTKPNFVMTDAGRGTKGTSPWRFPV